MCDVISQTPPGSLAVHLKIRTVAYTVHSLAIPLLQHIQSKVCFIKDLAFPFSDEPNTYPIPSTTLTPDGPSTSHLPYPSHTTYPLSFSTVLLSLVIPLRLHVATELKLLPATIDIFTVLTYSDSLTEIYFYRLCLCHSVDLEYSLPYFSHCTSFTFPSCTIPVAWPTATAAVTDITTAAANCHIHISPISRKM